MAVCLSVAGCRFLDAGKKLFLCSNSGFSYVDGGLRYLLGASTTTNHHPPPQLTHHPWEEAPLVEVGWLPGWAVTRAPAAALCVWSAWRELFDVVIVSAGKPSFYTSDRPFRQISPVTGRIQWTQVSG